MSPTNYRDRHFTFETHTTNTCRQILYRCTPQTTETDTLLLDPTNYRKNVFLSVKPNKLHRQTSSCLTPLTTATDPLLFERETDTLLLDPTNFRDRHLTVEPSNCEKKNYCSEHHKIHRQTFFCRTPLTTATDRHCAVKPHKLQRKSLYYLTYLLQRQALYFWTQLTKETNTLPLMIPQTLKANTSQTHFTNSLPLDPTNYRG